MYKWIVFAYNGYSPRGGMKDCMLKCNTFNEVLSALDKLNKDCYSTDDNFNVLSLRSGDVFNFETDSLNFTGLTQNEKEVVKLIDGLYQASNLDFDEVNDSVRKILSTRESD